jgi:cyclohexanone monooxygenase
VPEAVPVVPRPAVNGTGAQPPAQGEVVDAVVIGAGFGGLYAVHHLTTNGFSVRGFEVGGGVGGTWYWNRYPGARCDIESVEYSYSFSEELQQEWTWTQRYPEQPELLAYIEHVADRFDLRRHFTFETRVESAVFDEETDCWTVTTDAGEQVRTRFVVTAVGCLSSSRIPDFPGLDRFQGRAVHTGRWPHEGVDFTGQRVALIGTGSSGIQSLPLIAEQAAHVTVFQRTPNFSISGANQPLDPEQVRDVKEHYAEYRDQARRSFGGSMIRTNRVSVFAVTEEERRAQFEARWKMGGFAFMAAFEDLGTDLAANALAAEFVSEKIRRVVHDPEIAERLIPTDHPIGSKRICVDTGYFETFNRDDVTLVDVKHTPIEEITETGVKVAGQVHEVDVIVFATGFDAMTGSLLRMDIRGRGGLTLREKWAAGPRTYLGLGTAGFPNLFTITGPGSPAVLSNVVLAVEQHVEWIVDCMQHMQAAGLATIEAEVDAEDDWVEHVNQAADRTLYKQANSWYLGANVPGKPRVFMPYAGGVGRYRKRCDQVAAEGYRGFRLEPAAPGDVGTSGQRTAGALAGP